MGLSVAIAGGIFMATALVIFGIVSMALDQLGEEIEARTEGFTNNDSIAKTEIRIFGINASSGSNLVNFTVGNEGIEKVWNYEEFDLYITYDANILGIKTRVTEQLSYNDTAFEVSPAQSLETLDFKIQRNCPIIADGALTVTQTAGVDYDAPSGEAFVRIVNTRLTGNGDTGGSTQDVDEFTAYISTADLPNQIIFTRDNNPGGLNSRVCYEIIEYIGIPGAENSFNVLEQTSVSYTADSLSVTGPTVNGVINDEDIVVFITGQAGNQADNQFWNQAMSIADWDKDLDQPIFRRGEANETPNDNDISYAIVEFTGNNWKIQRFEYAHVVPGDDNVQADVTMDGFSGRPLPVNDLSKAFLHTQFISDDGPGTDTDNSCGLNDCGANAWLSAADTVSFHYDGVIPELLSMTTVSWIIENIKASGTTMFAQHISGTKSGGAEEDIFPIAIPTPISSLSTTSIMGENARSTGSGIAYPRGAIAFELTADDTVTGYRSDNGQTQTFRLSVVEYPQSEKCIGSDSSIISIDEWTMSCITYDYLDPGIVNPNEAPEILTKLQHPIFANGFLQITMSTDNGEVDSQTRTVV